MILTKLVERLETLNFDEVSQKTLKDLNVVEVKDCDIYKDIALIENDKKYTLTIYNLYEEETTCDTLRVNDTIQLGIDVEVEYDGMSIDGEIKVDYKNTKLIFKIEI